VMEKIKFIFVENIEDVLQAALTPEEPAPRKKKAGK